jgi:serine/threonine protein phosphatase PrpC
MVCPSCNTPNRDDAKFCKSCGQPLYPQQVAVSEAATSDQVPATPPLVQEFAESLPAQEEAGEQESVYAPVEDAEDVSLEPTLILTPDKMIAYHNRRWQQELERTGETPAKSAQQATAPESQSTEHADIGDASTAWSLPSPDEQSQAAGSTDSADTPAISHPPASDDYEIIPPPPPPQGAEESATPSQAGETGETIEMGNQEMEEAKEISETEATIIAPEQEKSEAMEMPSDQPDTPASTNGFQVLSVGTNLLGRYEVTQVISETPQEHVYQVTDHQGYQHCWNCGSEQNTEEDEYCTECGASLLNVSYIMHEYSTEQSEEASEGHGEDSHVLQGTIVNTFIEQGHTYVIEQPQAAQSPFPNGVQLLAAANSDAGDVRRSEPNEDSTLVLFLQRVHESISAPLGVFIVADGLGGHDNGQVASRMTINIIAERMGRELLAEPLTAEKDGEPAQPFDEEALKSIFRSAIEDANVALCQKNQQDKTDMGSTITGFMVVGEHAHIINVGDSRTYMLRGKQLYQLTTDHSLVGQLVAGGLIEPDDVYTHPQRSQIYRSLGDKPNVQIDIFEQQLNPGDILLSCSDGAWEMVRNPQIESILANAPDPQTACTQLIEAANANGGEDNISAVIVFVR